MFFMRSLNFVKKIAILPLCLLVMVSCFAGESATEDDNKDIKKIIKDGSFLFFNYFGDAGIKESEGLDDYEWTLKLRADEDYAYNIVKVSIAKEDKGGFYDISYTLMLDQSKGKLEVSGEYKTRDNVEKYISSDIVEKLVENTECFDKVVLNNKTLDPKTVEMDIF